jgi:oligoribonuclease (3'-5' exoribonuclease)
MPLCYIHLHTTGLDVERSAIMEMAIATHDATPPAQWVFDVTRWDYFEEDAIEIHRKNGLIEEIALGGPPVDVDAAIAQSRLVPKAPRSLTLVASNPTWVRSVLELRAPHFAGSLNGASIDVNGVTELLAMRRRKSAGLIEHEFAPKHDRSFFHVTRARALVQELVKP